MLKKSFRPYPPLQEDFNTSIIRIESSQMRELGINPGDVVRVTGVRSTGAICMPIEDGYKQPSDSTITYLSESGIILPQARISNIVALNTNNEGASVVEIEKVAQSTPAQRVIFTTLDARCIEKSLDKDRFVGLVVCKGDRIIFNDDEEPALSCLFWVTDTYPNDFSIIDKGTKIEFIAQSLTRDELKSLNCFAELEQLKSVIAIAKHVKAGTVDIIIPSIEIYDNGARFYIYLRGTYGSRQKFAGSPISFALTAKDNIGNLYAVHTGGGGGSSSPDGFNYNWSCILAPKINSDAKELTITLKEILIQAPFPPHFKASGSERRLMVSAENRYPDMLVLPGPWEFKVALQQ